MEPPRLVHSPWYGLLVSILTGPMCKKLVAKWNRLGILCVMHVFTVLEIALAIPLLEIKKMKSNECCFSDCRILVHKSSFLFKVKLTFELLIVHGQQHSFSTHQWMFLWKCQSFWDRKCLDLRTVNCVRATALIFDTWKNILVKVSKLLRQKMFRPERDSNPRSLDSCPML